MKKLFVLIIIISFLFVDAQENKSPNYSNIIEYRENMDIVISSNNDTSDFLVSILGENITLNNLNKDQIQIRNNKKKHQLFIDAIKTYNPTNEIYYFSYEGDGENEKLIYKTNTNRKRDNDVSNAVLIFQIDYLGICGDMFFVYFFDVNTSEKILMELSKVYENKNAFKKLINIIKNNN